MFHLNVWLGTVKISSGGGDRLLSLRSVKNPSDLRKIQSRYNNKKREKLGFNSNRRQKL